MLSILLVTQLFSAVAAEVTEGFKAVEETTKTTHEKVVFNTANVETVNLVTNVSGLRVRGKSLNPKKASQLGRKAIVKVPKEYLVKKSKGKGYDMKKSLQRWRQASSGLPASHPSKVRKRGSHNFYPVEVVHSGIGGDSIDGTEQRYVALEFANDRETLRVTEATDPKDVPDPPVNPHFDPNYKAYRPYGICPGYINRNGTYSYKGKLFIKEMMGQGKAQRRWKGKNIKQLFLNAPMNQGRGKGRCPGWKKMSINQKLNYYVALFGLLAYPESTCREKLLNSCTGGRCGGEMQIPESWNGPRPGAGRAGRGPGCSFDEKVGAINKRNRSTGFKAYSASWRNNTTCAVQIMANTICGFHTRRGNGQCHRWTKWTSPWSKGYWQPMNQRYNIFERLSKMPGCQQ